MSIITGHFREHYSYIIIVSVGVVLMVWMILMAAMKCEAETETRLMEVLNTFHNLRLVMLKFIEDYE